MQQAIQLLQLPTLELMQAIEVELNQNPVLEVSDEGERLSFEEDSSLELEENIELEMREERELKFDEGDLSIFKRLDEDFREHFSANEVEKRTKEEGETACYLESLVQKKPSLFEHLMEQAAECFERELMPVAEAIIGNLDERGFLELPLEEIALLEGFEIELAEEVLEEIQTFEPFGVGAKDLQESLLIQLRCLGKKKRLAYRIVERHFDDMLHNRIPLIQKGLMQPAALILEEMEKTIAKLDLKPGYQMSLEPTQYITADVAIRPQEDGELFVDIPSDSFPRLRLTPHYLRMLDDPELPMETKDYIKQKILSGKWLMKSVMQRNDTISRIGEVLLSRQRQFFDHPKGRLIPLTMKTVAEELDLHESTVARAISNKYIDSPRGLLPLRFFFTNAYTTDEGDDISSSTVKKLLLEMVQKEDKKKPLSDAALSDLFKEKGILCARRTIAKYRGELNLGSAAQRKKY
ncbi:MAG: rpoN [Chlamydiales bacterium]|nr:rpoN [Chlamydiales bacterium]